MTGSSSPFNFINSKIRGRSWNLNASILSSLRRSCKAIVTGRIDESDSPSSSQSSSNASSPTKSSHSKKSAKIFSKRSKLWRRRRESRDDFGNRWSKIYIPGHSRSATPLPDVVPLTTASTSTNIGQHQDNPQHHHNRVYQHHCINNTPNTSTADFFSENIEIASYARRLEGNFFGTEFENHQYTNELGFVAELACYHLNMSMNDVEHDEVFGHTFSLTLENDPYLMNDLDDEAFRGRNPLRRTLSWLSWGSSVLGSSLNLPPAQRTNTPVTRSQTPARARSPIANPNTSKL